MNVKWCLKLLIKGRKEEKFLCILGTTYFIGYLNFKLSALSLILKVALKWGIVRLLRAALRS